MDQKSGNIAPRPSSFNNTIVQYLKFHERRPGLKHDAIPKRERGQSETSKEEVSNQMSNHGKPTGAVIIIAPYGVLKCPVQYYW
jgi:hypothetical protein